MRILRLPTNTTRNITKIKVVTQYNMFCSKTNMVLKSNCLKWKEINWLKKWWKIERNISLQRKECQKRNLHYWQSAKKYIILFPRLEYGFLRIIKNCSKVESRMWFFNQFNFNGIFKLIYLLHQSIRMKRNKNNIFLNSLIKKFSPIVAHLVTL